MKTRRILAIFFVAMVIIETFYPLGDIVCFWLGDFGRISGNIFTLLGVGSLAWEITQILGKYEVKNNIE